MKPRRGAEISSHNALTCEDGGMLRLKGKRVAPAPQENNMIYGLLDFARYIHKVMPLASRGFYQWQYTIWLKAYHPLEHDRYLNLLEERGKK